MTKLIFRYALFMVGICQCCAVIAQDIFPGVSDYQKISDTEGNFTGTLNNSDLFGTVTSIGDLNDDGIGDVAIGALKDDDGGADRGAVWIIFLNDTGAVKSHQKISSTTGGFTGTLSNSDYFGYSVAGIGDLDKDGVEDIAVGAPQDDDGGANKGAVWILFLNTDGTVKSHQKISDTQGNFTGTLSGTGWLGAYLNAIGDINDDGVTDLAVGNYRDDDGGTDRGAVWIMMLNSTGTVADYQKISDTQGNFTGTLGNSDNFGNAVAGIGDVNNDGVEDIAVGAFRDDDGGTDRGAVWILMLNDTGAVASHQKIAEPLTDVGNILVNEDRFGTSIACVGDLNNDGVEDLLIGANRDNINGGTDDGAAYMVFLTAEGTHKSITKIDENYNWNFSGLDATDFFGGTCASLGDLDGNGTVDFIIGAASDGDGGTDRGAAYILFMDSIGDYNPAPGTVGNTAAKISDSYGNFTGTLDNSDNFGYAISNIGDLDGDGTNDMVVSAHKDDDGGTDRGAVWVLFMNDDHSVSSHQKISDTQGSFTGTLANSDWWGKSVAHIGDLNNDGVEDLAVGAPGDDTGGSTRGAVWILFMNANGTVSDYQKISDTDGNFGGTLADGDQFGEAVAGIGDINKDGVEDIAVGAFGSDDGSSDRGAIYILFMTDSGYVASEQKIGYNSGGFTYALASGALFGCDITTLGDINKDGVNDIAVGARRQNEGAIFTLLLNNDGTVSTFTRISSNSLPLGSGAEFGISLSNVGDLNSDGVEDVVVGDMLSDDALSNSGGLWVLLLDSDGTLNNYQRINLEEGNYSSIRTNTAGYGVGVAYLGVDNSGFHNVVVGDYLCDDGGTDRGAVWVYDLNNKDYTWLKNKGTNLTVDNGVQLNIDGNLIHQSSGTVRNHGEIAFTNGLANTGGRDVFSRKSSSTGQYIMNGSGDQKVHLKAQDNNTAFTNLVVNKPSGTVYFTAGGWFIEDTLQLISGILYPDTAELMVDTAGVIAGGNDTAFVAGPIDKWGDKAFYFPVGKHHSFHPIDITAPQHTTAEIRAEYFEYQQPYGDSLYTGLDSISNVEYWLLEHLSSDTDTVSIGIGIDSISTPLDSIDLLAVAYWDSIYWTGLGVDSVWVKDSTRGYLKGALQIALHGAKPVPVVLAKPTAQRKRAFARSLKRLNAGYFQTLNGHLYFEYKGEYNTGTLTYNVYDELKNVVASNNATPGILSQINNTSITTTGDKERGENRFDLDLSCSGEGLIAGYYILEVVNEKNEALYLRFYQDRSYVCN